MQHYILELDYNSDPWERQYITLGILECTEEKGAEMVNVINEWIKKTAQEHPLEPDFGAGEWPDEDDVKVENWRQVCDDFLYCKSEKGNLIYYTGRYWYQSSYPMENFLSISSKTKFNTTEELEMWMRQRMWELG